MSCHNTISLRAANGGLLDALGILAQMAAETDRELKQWAAAIATHVPGGVGGITLP